MISYYLDVFMIVFAWKFKFCEASKIVPQVVKWKIESLLSMKILVFVFHFQNLWCFGV